MFQNSFDYQTFIFIIFILIFIFQMIYFYFRSRGSPERFYRKTLMYERIAAMRKQRLEGKEELFILEEKWASEKESLKEKRKSEIQKRHFLKNFYYINDNLLESLYNQIPQILEPKQISVQKTTGSQTGKSLTIPIGGVEGIRTEENQIVEKYQIKELSSGEKFNRLQDYLIKNDFIILGLEEFNYNKYIIEAFEKSCVKMLKSFNFITPQENKEEYISTKKKEYALQYIQELQNILTKSIGERYTIIREKFTIVEITENFFKLSFTHPLNEHLLDKENEIQIQIECAMEFMKKRGKTYFKKNESIPIICLGSIIIMVENILKVEPIAIY